MNCTIGLETLDHGNMSYHNVRFDQLGNQERDAMIEHIIRLGEWASQI